MKLQILIILLLSSNGFANMKSLSGSMQGEKMLVEYTVLNTGRHILIAKEKIGMRNNKAAFIELSVTDLNILTDESLSNYNGFQCRTADNQLSYAVIAKTNASENKPFKPERAWSVDKKNLKLLPINPNDVNCIWSPEGDAEYPYK